MAALRPGPRADQARDRPRASDRLRDDEHWTRDHNPSYLWSSATQENSQALIPFLRPEPEGAADQDADETLSRAIEARDGRVVDPAILAFQGRSLASPHAVA